ncbi:MAG TPA: M3 family oligoendopeptidase [Candidatus Limnocylindria bacterium]|nr:M3 family oligoendopeptidase [Candidatus Limnocylindria bacterium]
MSLLPFTNLPVHSPRRFVPAQIDLGDWSQVAPLYDALTDRAAKATTLAEFVQWLLDGGELAAALDEESAKRYIAMTCHTDSQEAEAAYLHFVEKIEPELKPRRFELAKLFLAHPLRAQLPPQRYAVFDRDTALTVEIYRPENVALETEEAKLGNEYNKLVGSLTVKFRDEEKTLPAMGRYQEEPDRALREEAWKLVADRRLADADKFDDLMDGLIKLRHQIAQNAGFANYRDFAFKLRGRFDYTPADCERFHDSIAAEVMPVLRDLQLRRREQLGVETLRPWDLGVDALNRPPLKPFTDTAAMERGSQVIFDRLDPELARGFATMRDLRLLDLANRKGKAPGGYQSTLSESRLPFIFMNAVGLQRDVETILHEAGHAFHALATREEDLYAYRGAPIEFCEVASMAMELLAAPHLDVFYSEAEAKRARRVHLEGIVGVFPWIATVDAFQHWLYTHPEHTRAERRAAWLALMDRFGGNVDWTGCEAARANLWHKQLHIFLYPFYYVEYGIAQLGALQVWANSRRDQPQALAAYKAGLALGGSRPLPELFAAAGCRFDFSRETLKPLTELVRAELAQLA